MKRSEKVNEIINADSRKVFDLEKDPLISFISNSMTGEQRILFSDEYSSYYF